MTANNLISKVEAAFQRVQSKIINFEHLIVQDYQDFEAWLGSKGPAADAALQELASLATIAQPYVALGGPTGAAVGVALSTVVAVADEADAVIHQAAANQKANKAAGLVNTAQSILSISAAVNTTHANIAAAKGGLTSAIAQAHALTATQPAPAP